MEQQSAGVRRGISDSSVSVSQEWRPGVCIYTYDRLITCNCYKMSSSTITCSSSWGFSWCQVASQEYALHMNSTYLDHLPRTQNFGPLLVDRLEGNLKKKNETLKGCPLFSLSLCPLATEHTCIDLFKMLISFETKCP